MSHRDRNENRARVDPNKLAKRTKIHAPKRTYNRKTCKNIFIPLDPRRDYDTSN